jgi:hypothetical protein
MRAYDFSTHNKTLKRDKSRYFTYAFIFLLLLAGSAFVYYVILNSPRILYYFRENKYSEIERAHASAIEAIQTLPAEQMANAKTGALTLPQVQEFLELSHALQKDHREDPILIYHEATVLDEIIRRQVAENPQALLALLFREFIGRPAFPVELDRELWQRALLAGRKARALGLPEVLAARLAEVELDVYLLGGRPWWESAQEIASSSAAAKKLPSWHLMQAGMARETPDFALVQTAFGPTTAAFAKAIYYLRSGNSPLGISNLRDLSRNQADAFARDHALYTLGFLSAREKRLRDQLFYYKQIRFAEFAPRYPFFVPELNYLLRFLGQQGEADQMMKAWEELKAQEKSQ